MISALSKQKKEDRISEKKASSTLKTLIYLFPYLLKYKKLLFMAIGCIFLAAFSVLLLPLAIRMTIDYGFESHEGYAIHTYFAGLFFLVSFLALASAGRYCFIVQLGERLVADLRQKVFAHLLQLSPGFFDQVHSGELISRLSADTAQIKSAMSSTTSIALRNAIMMLGAVVMMFVTSVKLSFMALIAIPFIVFPLIFWGQKLRQRTKITQEKIAAANALASEHLMNIRTVQAFTAENHIAKHFADLVQNAYKAAIKSVISRSILTGVSMFLIFSSVIGILWIGAQDVLHHKMSAGGLGQFVLYTVFAASSLGQLSEVVAELYQALGAGERLVELLQAQSPIKLSTSMKNLPLPLSGEVKFSSVSFSYPTKEKPVLKDLSFTIHPGETVAFVGPSGSGKTTIFSLLLRFYDTQKGQIKLDGQDIKELSLTELRQQIAYVPQEIAIFQGNFYENIAFGKDTFSEEEIIAAAKTAQAYDFIMHYPKGFATELGERGVILSGGQKQRIALARAVLQNAPLLLLDEATSALDAESEMLVESALDTVIKDRTTLVIAHRLATILKADRIFVLDDGHIVEMGRHEELIAKQGLYARLAALQFSHDTQIAP